MSDEFDDLFQRLRGQQPPLPFAGAESVRRRGSQRSQHQALVAGFAVVAVTAGGGVGLTAGVASMDRSTPPAPSASATTVPLPTSPASPPASPTPGRSATASPGPAELDGLMLRPSDLGPGSWVLRRPSEPFDRDLWRWTSACPAYRSTDYPSLRRQKGLEVTGFAAGTGADAPYVFEHVHRYAVGWGPRALDDVRRAIAVCGEPPDLQRSVVDSGFAGDEALLIREEVVPAEGDRFVTLAVVVRVGDLVATVMFSPDRDQQYARAVASAAAQRLAGG